MNSVINELLDLVEQFKMDELQNRYAVDGVLELPNRPSGLKRTMTGRDEIGKFLRTLPKALSSLKFPERRIYSTTTPNLAVAEYKGVGLTHQGRPYDNTYIAVFQFNDDGEILLWREYFDPEVLINAFAP